MKSITKISIVVCLNLMHLFYASCDTQMVNITMRWVYVPDKDGIWYWQDLDDMGVQPAFDAQKDVKFYLFTRRNPEEGQELKIQDITSIADSHFDKNKPTRLICHGWFNNLESIFSEDVRKAFLENGDFNVVVTDWGKGANNILYPIAAKRTMEVGITVANLLNFWHLNGYLDDFNNLNMVGHSLGAHIVGIAGKNLLQKAKVIYGLDPAGPLFYKNEPTKRMDKNDAQLTVGLRTNTGPMGFGFTHSVALMEFLPNGGVSQPGCYFYFYNTCAHSRAYEFFIESLGNENFIAVGCESFEDIKKEKCTPTGAFETFVGESINATQGYFYFKTDRSAPFGLGSDGVPN